MKPCATCKEKPRLSYRPYCRDCESAKKKDYDARNPHKRKEWRDAFKARNPEYRKAQYEANREKENLQSLAWYYANRSASYRNKVISRAEKCGHTEHFTLEEFQQFLAIAACEDCGSVVDLTVGHLMPLMYPSSSNLRTNLVRQCKRCNDAQGFFVHYRLRSPELEAVYRFWNGPKPKEKPPC